ncbi:MAG: amidohydrolase family protein [Planctomycetota bacterium]|jgi:predicted TIM-barrel fold metal-dependent hydrolase|nr:amidohydrolase family protein [Planctomycetota bacterium]MDP7131173.1 amidohydrolase family protein [Planctomycetota bacterium]MDP7252921.1 amidohydrolase family protein [Planctomycetota bacterium]
MIIDAHTHVFNANVGGSEENFPLWPGTKWGASAPDLLSQMDAAGIEKTILISYTPVDVMAHYPPEKRDHMLAVFQHYLTVEYFVQVWQEHPDRFIWFADSIDPRVPGYVERAADALDLGALGLKLLPLFVDTEMGNPAWRPIFELLRERNKPCIIDLSWWYAGNSWFSPSVHGKFETYTKYVAGMETLVADFPDVKIQLAHYGTPKLLEGGEIHYGRLEEPIRLIRDHANLSCDLAAYQHMIRQDEPYPYWTALKIVEIMVKGIGADRIQWGTDWPYLGHQPYPELIRSIREADFLKEGEADKILGLNALKFLEEP